MNQLDEWTHLISKRLKSESELVGVQAKHELYQDSAKETFIRVVLEEFLPSNFAVGTGRVIDSEGNKSNEQDIVIYRRDYPQLNLPGGTDIFLLESVLATIQVKTKLIRKTFFEALDQCASMADLQPVMDRSLLARIAAKNNLTLNQNNEYQHTDPLTTARFNLIGRPLTLVYAFNGYQNSFKQLAESIDMWIDYRIDSELPVDMKSCAAIIATQGCFAARNASPFSTKKNFLFGIGNDDAPVRLIIMQLMHALNRRLRKDSDSLGVKQGLDAYLSKMRLPKITGSVGKIGDAVQTAPKPVQPTKIKAPTGLGSGIQSTYSSTRAPQPQESSNEKDASVETVRVPPIKQAIDPLIQTQTMQTPKQAAEAEPDSFLQPMQIPKPQPATDHLSQTIPRLKH
ncbi:MAG: hypothetical protein ACI9YO_001485 [Gammaproteobacteria bacterium]|jgi:hypothetical protein